MLHAKSEKMGANRQKHNMTWCCSWNSAVLGYFAGGGSIPPHIFSVRMQKKDRHILFLAASVHAYVPYIK